jgi:hypothetical protein
MKKKFKSLCFKTKRKIHSHFLHCSASDLKSHDNPETIDGWNRKRGFTNIGYNYFISKDGTIYQCRNLGIIPAAQKGYNTGSVATCLSGLHNFTHAEILSFRYLHSMLCYHNGRLKLSGHCEVNSNKTCPNIDYNLIFGDLL